MSRIEFKAKTNEGVDVSVVAGWDEPLKYYFMDVFYIKPPTPQKDALFNCLDLKDVFKTSSTERWQSLLLHTFGITAPEGFWKKVELKERNVFIENFGSS